MTHPVDQPQTVSSPSGAKTSDDRIAILDGWRALSILAVLAGHLLPLGPKSWELNGAVAASGMAIFFTLSGFLITRLLLADPRVPQFLIRRLFRIVPLAWVAMIVLAIATQADAATLLANLAFYANLPPAQLMHGGEHLWSLCVEVQFYMFAAIIVLVAGRRALFILPVMMVAVTSLRIAQGAEISIITWQRVDEILAGATLALLYHYGWLQRLSDKLPSMTVLALLPVVIFSAHPASGAFMYARPYVAAAAVGISIFSAPAFMRTIFVSRPAVYVAATSYALYVFHGMLSVTWLGSGDTLIKYSKRPFLIVLTFALAHLSTFRFEARMIALGKILARRVGTSKQPSSVIEGVRP
ncbi:MAG: acyltransferase [Sphingomonadales bacterium]